MAAKLGVRLNGKWTCLSLWGDAAPSTERVSLYGLCFTMLNGSFRKQFGYEPSTRTRSADVGALADAFLIVSSRWWHGA